MFEDDDELAPTAVAVLTHIVQVDRRRSRSGHRRRRRSGRRLTLNVRVGAGDLGRVIGRRGRTASSIRTVARAAPAKTAWSIDIEFLDD